MTSPSGNRVPGSERAGPRSLPHPLSLQAVCQGGVTRHPVKWATSFALNRIVEATRKNDERILPDRRTRRGTIADRTARAPIPPGKKARGVEMTPYQAAPASRHAGRYIMVGRRAAREHCLRQSHANRRAASSAGRALRSQRRGRGFESHAVHHSAPHKRTGDASASSTPCSERGNAGGIASARSLRRRTVQTPGRLGWAPSGAVRRRMVARSLRRRTVQTPSRLGWAPGGAVKRRMVG